MNMSIFQCFLTSPPQAWNTQKCKTLPFQNPRHDPPISWIISSTRITAKLPHRPTIENEFHLMLKWSEINPRWHIFDKHMQHHKAEAHIDRNKAATKCRSLGKRRVSERDFMGFTVLQVFAVFSSKISKKRTLIEFFQMTERIHSRQFQERWCFPCFVRTGELTGVPGKSSTVTQAGTVHVILVRMARAGDWRNMLLGPEQLSQPYLRQLLQRFSKPSSEGGPPHDP